MALGIFLGWSLNLNYTKFNKETIWIYQSHKKTHKYIKYYNFFCTNKENKKKKKRLIKDKVQIENVDMRIIKWPQQFHKKILYNKLLACYCE